MAYTSSLFFNSPCGEANGNILLSYGHGIGRMMWHSQCISGMSNASTMGRDTCSGFHSSLICAWKELSWHAPLVRPLSFGQLLDACVKPLKRLAPVDLGCQAPFVGCCQALVAATPSVDGCQALGDGCQALAGGCPSPWWLPHPWLFASPWLNEFGWLAAAKLLVAAGWLASTREETQTTLILASSQPDAGWIGSERQCSVVWDPETGRRLCWHGQQIFLLVVKEEKRAMNGCSSPGGRSKLPRIPW